MTKRPAAREVLTSAKPLSAATWIKDSKNAEAREFVRTWSEMYAKGETDWGERRVLAHLRSQFDFPFTSRDAVIGAVRGAK